MRDRIIKIGTVFLVCGCLSPALLPAADQAYDFYPEIEPFETGFLKVSDTHEIYYELCGNPNGQPVMVLHGGPGGGSYPGLRRFHDPSKWLIVLHDQRGAGKSKPHCELRDNNTQALVDDIEKLRLHLKLAQVQIFGGSWGSTLGVAYAEAHPENVSSLILRGVFLGSEAETSYFYHGGAAQNFPDAFAKLQALVPEPQRLNYPEQLLKLLQSDDAEVRRRTAIGWASYEIKISSMNRTDAEIQDAFKDWDPYDFSLIENYYMANHCFVKDDELLSHADRIAAIPTVIVQGRWDMACPPITAWKLHKKLPKSKLVIVETGAHGGGDPPMRSALVEATKSFEVSEK